ncbi:MAG TPA: acetyltransferase [Thioalkalivibrio sp.]|nr:acetyltransferase [Thioalkalivibrio sp.]
MFLREKKSNHLVEILDTSELFDPTRPELTGRYNWGEDLPEPQPFAKADLIFPSGEALPRCWTDVHYRDNELRR